VILFQCCISSGAVAAADCQHSGSDKYEQHENERYVKCADGAIARAALLVIVSGEKNALKMMMMTLAV